MTWRSVVLYSFIAVLYAFALIQLIFQKNFKAFCSACKIEKGTAPENDRTLGGLHDQLEDYIQIVLPISLVLTNVKGFLAVKVPIEYRLKASGSNFTTSGSGCLDQKYDISAEQIDVLRNTGISWTVIAIASAKTLWRRKDYGIPDCTSKKIATWKRKSRLKWKNVNHFCPLWLFIMTSVKTKMAYKV